MRRFIYSTKKINASVDVDSYDEYEDLGDLYIVKIWHEIEPDTLHSGPVAGEEIIPVKANSPQQAIEWAKLQWDGPIDRIEIVDVNPEGYEEEDFISACGGVPVMSSDKHYADKKTVEDDNRAKMYRASLYPQYDEKRIDDLLAIDWNDVVARDAEDFLSDEEDFPDLADIASIRYAYEDELPEGFDGAYIVTYKDGDETPAAWKNGEDGLTVFAIEASPEDEIESCDSVTAAEEITFKDWLDKTYYEGFDTSSLSDEEFWELEDQYRAQVPKEQRERNYR